MRGALFAAAVLMVGSALAETEESAGFDRWYVGSSAAITLPQGGSRMHRVGGASAKVGYYLSENLAFEGEAAWLEDVAGVGLGTLWHLQGWGLYGDLFGYSRFDPFLTGGVRGWIGGDEGQVGPKAGIGAFYHLTDDWALRADADATLGLDIDCEMLYTISVGAQYSF